MKSILLCISFFICVYANAQVNILKKVGFRHIIPESFTEYKGGYYFFSSAVKDSVFYTKTGFSNCRATQVYVHKVDKYTNVLLATSLVLGDTVQADSIADITNCFLNVINDRIHIVYLKSFIKATNSWKDVHEAIYYMQLDTNLNITMPERRLKYADITQRIDGIQIANVASTLNNLTIAFLQRDSVNNYSGTMSKYLQLDLSGNILKEGLIGRIDTSATKTQTHQVYNIKAYNGNRYMVSGYGILQKYAWMFYTTDDTLGMIDTGGTALILSNIPPDIEGDNYWVADLLQLDNSETIIAGCILRRTVIKDSFVYHTALGRYNVKNPNTSMIPLVIRGKDANDYSHYSKNEEGPLRHLVYNKNDHYIYYANAAYTSYGDGQCIEGNNYLQIICADTNMNLKWRKFIFSGNDSCLHVKKVISSHERSGIVISGTSFSSVSYPVSYWDTTLQVDFAYRVDSDGYVGEKVDEVTRNIIRDRIELYPNPSTGIITINDIYHGAGKCDVYNMEGHLVKSMAYNRYNSIIDISAYPAGLYLMRIVTNDGENYSYKIRHQ